MVSGIERVCSDGAGWGRWQARLALLLSLPVLLTGLYGTNYVFLAADIPYRCHVPECEGNTTTVHPKPQQWSPAWAEWALPKGTRCHRWASTDNTCQEHSFERNTSIICDRFVYQSSSSIVAEFELACQEWKRTLVGTVHNVGMLVSLPLMGYVSDRWGRRTALVVSGIGAGVLGVCKSFVNSYDAYLLAELLETVMGASVYPAAFVLMIEWLGVEHRILASLVLGIPLSLGAVMLSFLDYMMGYWRLWARVAYPPSIILLLYPWLLPESIRWLVTKGRVSEAVEAIKKAARWNRVPVPEETLEKMLMNDADVLTDKVEVNIEDESLLKAFMKYGALRRRLCVCFAWWVSAVFVFYGLAVRAPALGGGRHSSCALVAAAELPALVLNTLLLDRVGRRPLLTAAFLLTATALIAIPCLPDSSGRGGAGTALYLAGKVGATMSLNALYVYTAELFPTRARQRLLAACSTLGRLGAILAPLTPLLATYRPWLPTALFGALPLVGAALTRLVPDTLRRPLPDSFADLESTAIPTSSSTQTHEDA